MSDNLQPTAAESRCTCRIELLSPHQMIDLSCCFTVYRRCAHCLSLDAEIQRLTAELANANAVIVGDKRRDGCIFCGGELDETTAEIIDGFMSQKHKNSDICLRVYRFRYGQLNADNTRLTEALKIAVGALETAVGWSELDQWGGVERTLRNALAAIAALEVKK